MTEHSASTISWVSVIDYVNSHRIPSIQVDRGCRFIFDNLHRAYCRQALRQGLLVKVHFSPRGNLLLKPVLQSPSLIWRVAPGGAVTFHAFIRQAESILWGMYHTRTIVSTAWVINLAFGTGISVPRNRSRPRWWDNLRSIIGNPFPLL
jgi:hypothetical protein